MRAPATWLRAPLLLSLAIVLLPVSALAPHQRHAQLRAAGDQLPRPAATAASAAAAPHRPPRPRPRVYGFSVSADRRAFEAYDWSQLTDVGWVSDPSLAAVARRAGAAVQLQALAPPGAAAAEAMSDPAKRRQWVQRLLERARAIGATGLNFDLEVPSQRGAAVAADYTALVREAAAAFRAAIPDASISVDVPWSPYDVDGRNYDWLGLAAAADMLFIMAYDMQSQITGRCVASANAPLAAVGRGVQQWLDLGLPASKLVLGLPWYGYDYPCAADAATGAPPDPASPTCYLAPTPFMGAPCSDAAGAQRCYSEIMTMLAPGGAAANATVWRDSYQEAPFFNYLGADGTPHQVWFDDPASLLPKYQVAVEAGLAGVGFWNLDCLAHGSGDPREANQTRDMWGAVATAWGAPPWR